MSSSPKGGIIIPEKFFNQHILKAVNIILHIRALYKVVRCPVTGNICKLVINSKFVSQ